jgi:hypothetical protein
MKPRHVVVSTFDGQRVVQRLGPDDVAPSAEELEAIASAWVASSGGVKPSVRVLETMPSLRARGVGGAGGAAGSLPRRR